MRQCETEDVTSARSMHQRGFAWYSTVPRTGCCRGSLYRYLSHDSSLDRPRSSLLARNDMPGPKRGGDCE
jgi:hypothetical protein